jgi:hypothetical protein
MAKVGIEGTNLVIEIEGIDKLWALRSRLTIPLANVRGATLDPGIVREFKGIKVAGTHMPGVLTAGTFRHEGERVFWDVHDARKAVVIELSDERYARLVVEVEDPRATVDLVEHAR